MATTAVSLTEIAALVDFGKVGRSAVYSKYNNGPRTLAWGTSAFTDDSSMYSVSTFTRKCLYVIRILGLEIIQREGRLLYRSPVCPYFVECLRDV
jgi:hypothetical protein